VPSFKSTFAYSRRLNRVQENYFLSEYIVHSVQTLADRLIEHCFTFVSANKDIPASFSSFLSRPSTQDRYEDSSLSLFLSLLSCFSRIHPADPCLCHSTASLWSANRDSSSLSPTSFPDSSSPIVGAAPLLQRPRLFAEFDFFFVYIHPSRFFPLLLSRCVLSFSFLERLVILWYNSPMVHHYCVTY